MNNNYIFILLLIIILNIIVSYNREFFSINTSLNYSIKQITPQVHYNSNSDICIVYVYTPNIYPYAKHSILNILSYAEKHSYGVIIYDQLFNDDVSPCWNKIAAIIENLSKYKYLIWIDADAIINNFNIKFESFIAIDPSVDLYLCYDIILQKECINSGIMIIKNTEWSLNLFKNVWNSTFLHGHNDQNVIFYEIVKELYPNSKIDLKYSNYCNKINHPKVKIFSENAFNTHILNFNQGDFIIHLMGATENARINVMRQINTKLNLDNYDKKDCIETLKLSNDGSRIQLIEEKCLI